MKKILHDSKEFSLEEFKNIFVSKRNRGSEIRMKILMMPFQRPIL